MEPSRQSRRPRKIMLSETRGHHYHSISCDACGRTRHLTGLCDFFPAHYQSARLDQIEERLRGAACGHKGAWIMVTSAPDCGAPRR